MNQIVDLEARLQQIIPYNETNYNALNQILQTKREELSALQTKYTELEGTKASIENLKNQLEIDAENYKLRITNFESQITGLETKKIEELNALNAEKLKAEQDAERNYQIMLEQEKVHADAELHAKEETYKSNLAQVLKNAKTAEDNLELFYQDELKKAISEKEISIQSIEEKYSNLIDQLKKEKEAALDDLRKNNSTSQDLADAETAHQNEIKDLINKKDSELSNLSNKLIEKEKELKELHSQNLLLQNNNNEEKIIQLKHEHSKEINDLIQKNYNKEIKLGEENADIAQRRENDYQNELKEVNLKNKSEIENLTKNFEKEKKELNKAKVLAENELKEAEEKVANLSQSVNHYNDLINTHCLEKNKLEKKLNESIREKEALAKAKEQIDINEIIKATELRASHSQIVEDYSGIVLKYKILPKIKGLINIADYLIDELYIHPNKKFNFKMNGNGWDGVEELDN
ncbi:MAG: hypothetical protein H0V82_10600 [Candidatus Protochlamydia sp.]|nr:hypothetical protein [Candidatus Protochlamydia sp.]